MCILWQLGFVLIKRNPLITTSILWDSRVNIHLFSDVNLSSDEDDSFVKFSTRKPNICQKRPVILQSDSDDDDVISLDTIKKKFGSVLKKDSRRKKSSSEEEEKDESKNEYDLDDSFLVEGEGVSILDDSGDEDDEESGTDQEDSTSKQS